MRVVVRVVQEMVHIHYALGKAFGMSFVRCRPRRCLRSQALAPMATTSATAPNLLVVASPNTPELSMLKNLPQSVRVVGIGRTLADLNHLQPEDWASIDVLLNCGVGQNAGKKQDIQVTFPERNDIGT